MKQAGRDGRKARDKRPPAREARFGKGPKGRARVHLNRAMSKLGILTRSEATDAILAGRVSVDGRVVRDPGMPIDMKGARIEVDGSTTASRPWRTILLHKPRGVVTTRADPEGRRTVDDVVGEDAAGLRAVGRLDFATSGLLLLTTDTSLLNWITDPENQVARVYVVTVRGQVTSDDCARLERGIDTGQEELKAASARLRKASARESHLTVELREGKNREVRRLFEAIGHEVTRLKRVKLGGLDLGDLQPGAWRDVGEDEVRAAFPRFVETLRTFDRGTSPHRAKANQRKV